MLLKVRDHVRFDDEAGEAADVRLAEAVSASLRDEVRLCVADKDMAQADVAGLLVSCLEVVDDEARAGVIGSALYAYVVNAVLAEGETSTLVQRTAELLDPDLTPHLAHRDAVRDAARTLALEPTLGRLSRLFHQVDPTAGRGLAFSLFQLVPGEDEAVAIAPTLPSWALTVLADTVLLRAAPEPLVAIDVPRRFLASAERGSILIGLAVAARQADPGSSSRSSRMWATPRMMSGRGRSWRCASTRRPASARRCARRCVTPLRTSGLKRYAIRWPTATPTLPRGSPRASLPGSGQAARDRGARAVHRAREAAGSERAADAGRACGRHA